KLEDLDIDEYEYTGYQSKYIDMYNEIKKTSGGKEKISVLDDIDFEIELLVRDEINVHYIIMLLKRLKPNSKGFEKDKKSILMTMAGDPNLRNKKDLIEEFIENQLLYVTDEDELEEELEKFIGKKKKEEFNSMMEEENLYPEKIIEFIDEYEYEDVKKPKTQTAKRVEEAFKEKLTLLPRTKKRKKVIEMVLEFMKRFEF
ncbi:MAG: hypothetical protein WBG30_09110, partial [Psychrilyobacter sp.]|uniref:type I restriction endonuclease subunit R, EcoR124 family n=1 Tax=Psychrilyobacter sp. TaxID=2586924 RepID=UPI003C76973B